jgi:hypothetical protein
MLFEEIVFERAGEILLWLVWPCFSQGNPSHLVGLPQNGFWLSLWPKKWMQTAALKHPCEPVKFQGHGGLIED